MDIIHSKSLIAFAINIMLRTFKKKKKSRQLISRKILITPKVIKE